MSMQEEHVICGDIVQKLIKGISLDRSEKSHLAACQTCIAEVVERLGDADSTNLSVTKEANGTVAHPTTEAVQALEHGRRVFEREFGILLARQT